jgi:hypothetical protein
MIGPVRYCNFKLAIYTVLMTLGNAVGDKSASSRTWQDWYGLQAGLQSKWYDTKKLGITDL